MRDYKVILAFLCATAPFKAHGMQWSKELVKRYANGLTANKCAEYIHKGATGLSNLIFFGTPTIVLLDEFYENSNAYNVDLDREQKIRTILKELDYPEKITKNVNIKFGKQYAAEYGTIYVPVFQENKVSIAHEGAHIYHKGCLRILGVIPSIFVGTHLLAKSISKPIHKWLYQQAPKNSLRYRLLKLGQSCSKLSLGLATKIGIACIATAVFRRNIEYQADMEAIKRIKDPQELDAEAERYCDIVELIEKIRPSYYPKALWEFRINPVHPNYEVRAAYFQKAADELRQKQQLEQEKSKQQEENQ